MTEFVLQRGKLKVQVEALHRTVELWGPFLSSSEFFQTAGQTAAAPNCKYTRKGLHLTPFASSCLHPPSMALPAPPLWVLPLLVSAQLLCCSTWFAANAVLPELLAVESDSGDSALGVGALARSVALASGLVQGGFIAGTIVIASTALADRFPPHAVFAASAAMAAVANALPLAISSSAILFTSRAITGVALAGVYPVGMRLAARLFPGTIGRSLGWLVGALVVGTAAPHLLRALAGRGGGDGVAEGETESETFDARAVLGVTSAVSAFAGLVTWGALEALERRRRLLLRDAAAVDAVSTTSPPVIQAASACAGSTAQALPVDGWLLSDTSSSVDLSPLAVIVGVGNAGEEVDSKPCSGSAGKSIVSSTSRASDTDVNDDPTGLPLGFDAVNGPHGGTASLNDDLSPPLPVCVTEHSQTTTHSRSATPALPPAYVSLASLSPAFRASVIGYFGHMWEVYTLWALAPLVLAEHVEACRAGATRTESAHSIFTAGCLASLPESPADDAGWVSGWTFVVIAVGAAGCVLGGYAAALPPIGSARAATALLALSGLACLAAPVLLAPGILPTPALLFFLIVWGAAAAGDSPQFSALIAASAPPARVGTALAAVTAIGFSVSAAALALVAGAPLPLALHLRLGLLAPGPAVGVWAMRRMVLATRTTQQA